MHTRWVPPYYQREFLQKLRRLNKENSVEEYYQELQTGMIRCGIVEENEVMLAHFIHGLNREIQTILEYKEYTNITRLFHLACKADHEVQDRQALARTNFSTGRPSSWTPRASSTSTAPAPPSGATSSRDTRKQAQRPLSAKSAPVGDAVRPTFIPIYTPTTPQAPRIHKMRPRLCAIGHKVNPFLNASHFHSHETWLLLQVRTLCILRYTRGDHGEPKDQVQACAEAKEGEGRRVCCYSNRISDHVPDIRPGPDIRPNARKSGSLLSREHQSRPSQPGHPPPGPDIRPVASRRTQKLDPTSPDILPQRLDIRRLMKARTSDPTPGHPAPVPACSSSGPSPMYPFVP